MKKIYICLILFLFCGFCFLFIRPFKKNIKDNFGEASETAKDEEVLARIKQEVLMTKDPALGYVPVERLEAAKKQWAKLAPGNAKNSASPLGSGGNILGTGLTWTERGPDNIGGRCRAILADQSDASGNTVLVGSVSGGLWRTTNFLNANPAWTQISSVSANLAITTLTQDPSNLTTMYAGTGEGYFNLDAVRGLGIYKSTDGGLTWSLLSSTTTGGANVNDFGYVQKVAVYSNGDVYASGISASFCNHGGILKSTDGGSTWTRVIGTFPVGGNSCTQAIDFFGYDIQFSLSGDIYATVVDISAEYNATPGNPAGKIYKSPAGATVGNSGTWTNVAPSAGTGNFWQRIQVACSPSNNNRLYAIFQGTANAIGAIERSDDGGTTWTNVSNATTWCDGGSSNGTDFSRGQAWYDLTIAVNPGNDAVVYAGGVDIFTTSNSGTNWSQLTQWAAATCGSQPYVHADIHDITFLPGSSTGFIVGCDGGVFYTSNSGGAFASKDKSLNVTQYYAAAIHPSQGSNYMLAGAQDNGSHIFNNAGINTVTSATGGDGAFCFIDQNNPNYQITSYTNTAYSRSTNGGTSFSTWVNSTNGRFINPADYDNTTQFLYCGYTDRRLRRIGAITSGTPTGTSFTVSGNTSLQVSAVKVDPGTTDSVWVAFSTADDASANQVPELYVIGGASTGIRTTTQLTGLALASGSYISSIDVEKTNPSHLLITVSNYGVASVWESKDKGTTWASLDNNGVNLPDLPVRWGMIVPSTANVGTGGPNGGVLLATELGVWSTTATNGTSTVWTQNATNMGNVRTDMLKFRTSDNYLVAATHGRGLFSTNLLTSPLAVSFVSFTGNAENRYNSLHWNVDNEINDIGFDIERKYAGESSFTAIGFVQSNTRSSSNQYNFTDNAVDLGKENVFYRLKHMDANGNTNYSSTVMITRKASSHFVEYISVNGNNLYIRLNNANSSEQINAQVLDVAGRLIMKKNIIYQSQYMDISNLAKGVYVLRLLNNKGSQFSQKFVKN
jgi:type IX secretion system substrate protein